MRILCIDLIYVFIVHLYSQQWLNKDVLQLTIR